MLYNLGSGNWLACIDCSALSIWVPGCQKLQMRFNLVWHRMLYSCTLMATVGVGGLRLAWSLGLELTMVSAYMKSIDIDTLCCGADVNGHVYTWVVTWRERWWCDDVMFIVETIRQVYVVQCLCSCLVSLSVCLSVCLSVSQSSNSIQPHLSCGLVSSKTGYRQNCGLVVFLCALSFEQLTGSVYQIWLHLTGFTHCA